jgi:adenylosuccinate lyase
MPQKRNPWNSEHVKSLWKAFYPRVLTFFADQISEHQRDLTNSASSRFISEYLAGFLAAVCRLEKVLRSLQVDRDRLEGNLRMGGDGILAEAAYILLAESGDVDAHEHVRLCTLEAERSGKSLVAILRSQEDLWKRIEHQVHQTIGIDPETFFSSPELYRGKAREKSLQVAHRTRKRMEEVKQNLSETNR